MDLSYTYSHQEKTPCINSTDTAQLLFIGWKMPTKSRVSLISLVKFLLLRKNTMRNFNRFVSASLLTTTAVLVVPDFFTQRAFSQTLPQQKLAKWEISQNDPPVDEIPGGKRPIPTCSIAPTSTETTAEVWSDRPLFYWRGPVGKIEVRKSDSKEALWSKTLTGQERFTLYEGEALQPGQTYSLVIFDLNNQAIAENTFQVMEKEKIVQIEKQLQVLESELKAKGASPEEIALSRADLFKKRQLWSDVWREIFSVKNPSAARDTYVSNIPKPACSNTSAKKPSPLP
jgi:hypothetical protein